MTVEEAGNDSTEENVELDRLLRAVEEGEPLKDVLEVDGVLVDAAIQRAWSFYEKDRFDEAAALAEGASALDVTRFHPHLLLGDICMRRGELARAAERFERALEIRPGARQARLKLTEIELRRGDATDAGERLEQLLDEEVDDPVRERAEVLLEQIN